MKTCLLQITGYKQLYLDVESVRKRPYDSENAQHEKLLLKVNSACFIWSCWTLRKIRLELSKVCVQILDACGSHLASLPVEIEKYFL